MSVDQLQRMVVRLPLTTALDFDDGVLIDVFHDWIRRQVDLGVMLFDVADYRHVPDGPGVMLVTHQVNFGVDHFQGWRGISAQRKQPQAGNLQQRIAGLVRTVAQFGALLEAEARLAGKLQVNASEFTWASNDRLRAANDEASAAVLTPVLTAVAQDLYGAGAQVVREDTGHAGDRLTLRVRAASAVTAADLAERAARHAA